MGIIQEVKTVINNQYIHVEDAIKYLAKIEEVSYEDVAQFLLKNKFFELCAGCSYTKSQYIGNFSCIDEEYDEDIGCVKPFIDCETGSLYSPRTEEFLKYVASNNELLKTDWLTNLQIPFNLYWKIDSFKRIIIEIYSKYGAGECVTERLNNIQSVVAIIHQEEDRIRQTQLQMRIKQLEAQEKKEPNDRESLLNIIYALKELVIDKGIKKNQAEIIDYLANEAEGYGLSEASLKARFAEANKLKKSNCTEAAHRGGYIFAYRNASTTQA